MLYPVKIKKYFNEKDQKAIKIILEAENLKCVKCRKKIDIDSGYVNHAFLYGFSDDNYCSDDCINGKR